MELVRNLWSKESKGKNFVYSPFSINAALSLLASGSSGETLEQLLDYLKHENLDRLNLFYSRVINQAHFNNKSGEPKLSFVNGVWVDDSCSLKPTFKETASSIYKANAKSVDFKTKAEEVREEVNKWVEDNTNGLIRDLLTKGSIHGKTRVLLTNALYFKGSWERAFDRSQTKNSEFYLLDGSSVQVPFMTSQYTKQYVTCYKGFKVLQLPYKQTSQKRKRSNDTGRLSMYIILPDQRDGLHHLIKRVSSDSAGFLEHYLPVKDQVRVQMGKFRIPKFKILFEFEASRVLNELGLAMPFDPTEAEFTGMIKGSDKLCVDKVFHKCLVDVDEEGTEAAAATSMGLSMCAVAPPPPVHFVADHPFMFMIRDNHTKVVLFMGHVLNPLLKEE